MQQANSNPKAVALIDQHPRWKGTLSEIFETLPDTSPQHLDRPQYIFECCAARELLGDEC